jgi:hypothetical protein
MPTRRSSRRNDRELAGIDKGGDDHQMKGSAPEFKSRMMMRLLKVRPRFSQPRN